MITFEGEKVRLRAVEPSDAELLYAWENDATIWPDGGAVVPYSKYNIEAFLAMSGDLYAARQLRLMVATRYEGKTVGCIDLVDFEPRTLKAEVSVLIAKEFRSNGYATEALKLMTEYAFRHVNLHQLYAYVSVRNPVSQRLFRTASFVQTAVLNDWHRNDSWCDCILFQKINNRN